jgi:hypothetical protein
VDLIYGSFVLFKEATSQKFISTLKKKVLTCWSSFGMALPAASRLKNASFYAAIVS